MMSPGGGKKGGLGSTPAPTPTPGPAPNPGSAPPVPPAPPPVPPVGPPQMVIDAAALQTLLGAINPQPVV